MTSQKTKRIKNYTFGASFNDFLHKNFLLVALFFLMSSIVIVLSGGMSYGSLSSKTRAEIPMQELQQNVFGNRNTTPSCNENMLWKWWCGASIDECQYCVKRDTAMGKSYQLYKCSDGSALGKGYLVECGYIKLE
jgi:hypothetical protein